MHSDKKRRLEQAGWKTGSADEFLGLSPEESAYIELKLRLSDSLKQRRQHQRLSQKEVAAMVASSQSRVAKMEAGDPSVSIDLLVKTLLALGASDKDLAEAIRAS